MNYSINQFSRISRISHHSYILSYILIRHVRIILMLLKSYYFNVNNIIKTSSFFSNVFGKNFSSQDLLVIA